MLNELFELSKALEHFGLLQPTTHPNIGNVGKAECLLFEIDNCGKICSSRFISKDETAMLWKHSKGNFNSFPAVRIQKPLLAVGECKSINDNDWQKAALQEKVEILESLNFQNINHLNADLRISDWSLKELNPVILSSDPELAALNQLVSVFPRQGQTLEFVANLLTFVRSRLEFVENMAEIDFLKNLLVGTLSKSGKTPKYSSNCMTYYDVFPINDFPNSVGSVVTRQALINALNNQKANQQNIETVISPFSGSESIGVGNKYPRPNLPALGLTYFYSNNQDIPCLKRYGLTGTDAFQAGKEEISAISDAIDFILNKQRENKSWKRISGRRGNDQDLILAFLDKDPKNDAFLAQILGDPSDFLVDDKEGIESAFDALCQQVLGKIEFANQRQQNVQLKLILLEKLDEGRKQVVYENAWSINQFTRNLLSWSEAAKNSPTIEFKVQEKDRTIKYVPICPGPKEIFELMRMNYSRSGLPASRNKSSISPDSLYKLYMPQDAAAARDSLFLEGFLSNVVERAFGLLGNLKNKMSIDRNNALPPTKEIKGLCRQGALFISLISILLWRLNIRKETYMLGAPFNVGQFLQLSDRLHKLYCVQVRNGGDERKPLPPQLIGNDLLVIVSENPVEGLIRLRDRMKIYLAWASTVTGEKAGLAKWILARLGEVSQNISANNLPERFTQTEQAQVLLGYLATIQFEKKEDKEEESHE